MKNLKEKRTRKQGYAIWLAALFIAILFGLRQDATAQDKLLAKENQKVYLGDVFDLSVCVEEKYRDQVEYKLQNENEDKASLSDKSLLHAKEEGEVLVDVIYSAKDSQGDDEQSGEDKTEDGVTEDGQTGDGQTEGDESGDGQTEEDKTMTETITITIIPAEKLELSYGESLSLPVEKYIYDLKYDMSSKSSSIRFFADGSMQVVGFASAQVLAVNPQGIEFELAEITVKKPSLGTDKIVRAQGSKQYGIQIIDFIAINGGKEHVAWATENEKIAKWTEEGLSALKEGKTVLTLEITAYNGDTVTISVPVIITDPKISTNKIILASGCKKKITITGTVEGSSIEWDKSQTGCAYFIGVGKIYADYEGSTKLHMTIDGREFVITVRVTDPQYGDFSIILSKGMSKNIKLSGLVKDSKVTYSSNKTTVATVSKTGKVKGKKPGHAVITVKADGRTLKLWTEVASKMGYQAAKKAIAISKTKTTYSQARRMSKGYYDCSSLVSRVYRNYGVYFGSRSGWSPVAANIGKWCVSNHKVVANKSVSYKKLLPGDIIFFSGWKNGRYKNITHVEMYVGGAKDVSASSRYNRVVHYGYSTSSQIVLIARPTR